MDWQAAVEVWFLGQGLLDHLNEKAEQINVTEREQRRKTDY